MDLDRALEHAISGDALMFAGAGFSAGAVRVDGQQLPLGQDLAMLLAEAVGLPSSTPLETASEEFVAQHGAALLAEEIRRYFTVSSVRSFHHAIAKIRWRRIYTTNYDNTVELAYSGSGRPIRSLTTIDPQAPLSASSTECVHLNGSVLRLDEAGLSLEFKLTETSYLHHSLDGTPWQSQLRADVALSKALFFVGYSLYDLDIRRLLAESLELKEKFFFVTGPKPAAFVRRRVQQFGNILEISTEEFAALLAQKAESYRPPQYDHDSLYALERIDTARNLRNIRDGEIIDMLLFGRVDREAIFSSRASGQRYLLRRDVEQSVVHQLQNGSRIAVLLSDLGNGKSCAVEGIAAAAASTFAPIVRPKLNASDCLYELDQLCRASSRFLLVVEDYTEWPDLIEHFSRVAPKDSCLLLTSRTATHEVIGADLHQKLSGQKITEFFLDVLSERELEWVIQLFNESGLWGERASHSHSAKLRFLSQTCGSEWHSILLEIMKAPQIDQRLRAIMSEITSNKEYSQILTSVLIFAVLGIPNSSELLSDIWSLSILNSAAFRHNRTVAQLIDCGRGKFNLRSSVVGKYLLQRMAHPGQTTEVLISVVKVLDKLRRVRTEYWSLLRRLMRFSQLRLVLPEQGLRSNVIKIYESIRPLSVAQGNPLFWLQYAIACTSTKEYERAGKYFETAYSFAKSRDGFDTYQIDNHFARYRLAEAIATRAPDSAMSAFREARKLIFNQLNDPAHPTFHYPFRVARLFSKFFEAFVEVLSAEDLEEVRRASKHVANKIDRLPDRQRQYRHIADARRELGSVIGEASRQATTPDALDEWD